MRPQKRKVQSRLSRSGRMRSAAVKQALATNAELVKPGVGYRRGVHTVEPTSATDALLFDQTAASLRRAAVEVMALVGVVALVSAVVVYLGRPSDRAPATDAGPFGLTPGMSSFLTIVATVTVLLAVAIVFRRWHQGRTAASRLTKEERRCTLAAGTLRVQERATDGGSRAHWLRPEEGDWMPIDRPIFEAVEPLLVATSRTDAAFDRQLGGDVVQEWTVPNATVLCHRPTRTIVEIHDAQGDLVYRHPKYQPDT